MVFCYGYGLLIAGIDIPACFLLALALPLRKAEKG
jgi:hypothetical protein